MRAGIGKLEFKAYTVDGQTADTGCKRVAFSDESEDRNDTFGPQLKLQSGYFKFHTPRLADSRKEDHNLRLQTGRDNIAAWERKV